MAKDILIVEPDRRTADTLVLRLSSRGYEARSAATVSEAEDAMQRLRPDLMIIGLSLPQTAPRHLCDQLRKMEGGALVPILLLDDGSGAVATQREAIALGADRLFKRPAEMATLIETAASLIGPSRASREGEDETVDFSSLNALLWSDAPADLSEGQWSPRLVGGSSDDATDISMDDAIEDGAVSLPDPPDADFDNLPGLAPTDLPSIDFTSLAERSGFDPSAIASADFASLNVILESAAPTDEGQPAPLPALPPPEPKPPAESEGTGFDWGEMPRSSPPPVGPFDSAWSEDAVATPEGPVAPAQPVAARPLPPRARRSAPPVRRSEPPVAQPVPEQPRQVRSTKAGPAPPVPTDPGPMPAIPAPKPAPSAPPPAQARPAARVERRSAPVGRPSSALPALPPPEPVGTRPPPPLADRPGRGWMRPAPPVPAADARWQAVLQPGRSIPLTQRGLGGVLIALSRLQITGRIEITAGGALRRIFFDAGRPVFFDSSSQDEDLGAWLAQEGQVTRGTLAGARTQAAQLGVPPEEVLIEQGFVTSEAVYRALAQHVAERIVGLFGLESGASLVIQGGPRPVDPVDLGMPIERLVLDGVRRKYGRLRLYRVFGTPVTVPRPGQRRPGMALRVDEQAALEAVDGQRTVAQIAQAVRMAEPDALAVLHGLALAGYVEPPAAAGDGTLPPLDAALIARADAPRTADELPGFADQVHAKLADANGGDYFAVLDVPPEATGAEIDAAYTTLRRRFDPHRVAGPLADQVREIADVLGDAFAILSDPRRRARYAEAISRRRIAEAAWQSSKS